MSCKKHKLPVSFASREESHAFVTLVNNEKNFWQETGDRKRRCLNVKHLTSGERNLSLLRS